MYYLEKLDRDYECNWELSSSLPPMDTGGQRNSEPGWSLLSRSAEGSGVRLSTKRNDGEMVRRVKVVP